MLQVWGFSLGSFIKWVTKKFVISREVRVEMLKSLVGDEDMTNKSSIQ
jgi:hypothetical protein